MIFASTYDLLSLGSPGQQSRANIERKNKHQEHKSNRMTTSRRRRRNCLEVAGRPSAAAEANKKESHTEASYLMIKAVSLSERLAPGRLQSDPETSATTKRDRSLSSSKQTGPSDATERKRHLLPMLLGCTLAFMLATTLASAASTQAAHPQRHLALRQKQTGDLVASGSQLGLLDGFGDASSTIAGSGVQGAGEEVGYLANEDDSAEPAGQIGADEHDESADRSHELPDRNLMMDHHNSQLRAMHDLFERRQLNQHQQPQLQSSQELSPISIGLDPAGSPFSMGHFQVPHQDQAQAKPPLASADEAMGPALPFGLNPLPHLLGFQNSPFEGPQRGDQSAHSNHHALPSSDSESVGGGQKVWPKIFRFTDGRISLEDFEKQKKIRLSNKNKHGTENHIESAPIMFDGRQLKRKSFLILHGGIFS